MTVPSLLIRSSIMDQILVSEHTFETIGAKVSCSTFQLYFPETVNFLSKCVGSECC